VSKDKLPKHIVDAWPEIFKDIELKVVPTQYLHSIVITFENGKIWEIDVQKSLGNKKDVGFEESLENIFKEYEDAIVNVDFRLDVQRVKADIQKRTQVFLKKRK